MSLSTILEILGLPTTFEILVAINVVSVVYLIWYAWHLFIANKGDPGSLGLMLAVIAFFNLIGEGADWYEDRHEEQRRSPTTEQIEDQSNETG